MRKNLGLAASAVVAGVTLTALAVPVANATEAPVETTTKAVETTTKPVETTTSKPVETTTTTTKPVETTTSKPEPKPEVKGGIFLGDLDTPEGDITNTVKAGGHYQIATFCVIDHKPVEPTGFHSDAMTIGELSPWENIWLATANVKEGVAAGSYAITGKCGDQEISWAITVVTKDAEVVHGKGAAKAEAKANKTQVAVTPVGKIETGGGATSRD